MPQQCPSNVKCLGPSAAALPHTARDDDHHVSHIGSSCSVCARTRVLNDRRPIDFWLGISKQTMYACRQLLLSHADRTPSKGGRHSAASGNSLQQTSDSTPSSSHQSSIATAQRNGNLQQQTEDVNRSSVGAGKHDVAKPSAYDAWSCLKGLEFVENLKNPQNLQPLTLPLELKLFSRVPVVVSARLFGQTGMPSETFARLLIT